MKVRTSLLLVAASLILLLVPVTVSAQCPVTVPVEGAPPPGPLP